MPKMSLIEMHMAAAHFPIGLLMSSFLFELLGTCLGKAEFRRTSYWILILGVLTGFGTLLLGMFGNPFFNAVGLLGNPVRVFENDTINKIIRHSWVGLTGLSIFALLAVWRYRRNDDFSVGKRWLLLAGMLLGFVAIGAAGYLGAHVMD